MTCEDVNGVNEEPWAGVIMKSTCGLQNSQGINNCQTVQRLDMVLQRELPVFDWTHNIMYRSITCARCNNAGNLSYWGLDVSCTTSSGFISTPVNIPFVKKFVKDHPDCSWKYAPMNKNQPYKSCVLHDAPCASNLHHLPVLSVLNELCSLYSMVFSTVTGLRFRNPHCTLCPRERTSPGGDLGTEGHKPPIVAPLSVLLDVSGSIPNPKLQKDLPPTLISRPPVQDYNLKSQVSNCTSNTTNCTVALRTYNCENFTLTENQSMPMKFHLNKSHVVILISQKLFLQEKNPVTLQGNSVYILCPENQTEHNGHAGHNGHASTVLIYITFTGTLLSIISLCFLLYVYLCFKELRNLPGKCLISLSVALLFYQAIFLGTAMSREVATLCKAVAIFLHLFLLAAFSWMSVMAFDTASTFTVKG